MRSAKRRISRHAAHFGESRRIGDDVIGGERDHQRIAVAFAGKRRTGRDRRSGIAPQRFEQ